jgi:hypothetical protein
MNQEPLDGAEEIDKLAHSILVGSRALGVFPTPVDQIVAYTDLSLERGVDLSKAEPSFFDASREFFGKVKRKVLGMIDFREKTIHLDKSQKPERQNFIKLHETGHGVIPCQRDLLGCMDDEDTIVPEIKELFERQASYFASGALFQLDRFDEEASKLPLGIRSARALAEKFGGSKQAAIRRYVERSPKRCALLVFHKPDRNGKIVARVRNYFESEAFTKAFGGMTWPDECGLEFPFVRDIKFKRKDHQDGQIAVTTRTNELLTLNYHFFDSTFNVFVMFFPPGERIASRVKIIG